MSNERDYEQDEDRERMIWVGVAFACSLAAAGALGVALMTFAGWVVA